MARPMILIKEELLAKMYEERYMGVPLCKIIKRHKLDITHPTLAKLIALYDAFAESSGITSDIIHTSLFPDWLKQQPNLVLKQPNNWYYTGTMPLGKWVKQEEQSNESNT